MKAFFQRLERVLLQFAWSIWIAVRWIATRTWRVTQRVAPVIVRATGRILLWLLQGLWQIIRGFYAVCDWLSEHILRGGEYLLRAWGRRIGQICFGNWRRTLATSVIAGLVAGHYYPNEVWPIMTPLLTIGVVLLGMRIMLIPFWPMRRQRQRSRQRR